MSLYLSYFTTRSYQTPTFCLPLKRSPSTVHGCRKSKVKSGFQLKLWGEFHVGKILISKLEFSLDTRANTGAFIKCRVTLNDYKWTSWPRFYLLAADFQDRRHEVRYLAGPPSATCAVGWEPSPGKAPGTVPETQTFRFPLSVLNVHSWRDISFLQDRSYPEEWQISLRGQRRQNMTVAISLDEFSAVPLEVRKQTNMVKFFHWSLCEHWHRMKSCPHGIK